MATPETEIRKLEPNYFCSLARILDLSDLWKKFMANIPNDENENQCMFTNDHITMIEEAIRQQGRSGATIFLTEWSTYGKNRPTCQSMLNLLVKLEMFRAADYLAVEILKSPPPERPKFGPAAFTEDHLLEELLNPKIENLEITDSKESHGTSSSIHIQENAINVIADSQSQENSHLKFMNFQENSDASIVRKNGSNLILFSQTDDKDLKKISEEVSDMMKFSNSQVNYDFKEAKSADIPLCVLQNNFQSTKINTADSLKSFESSSVVESSDNDSQATASSIQEIAPSISDIDIPLVVQEFNTNKNDT